MEAAFVDIGRGRNAVLYSGEVDWDAVETGNQPRRIELALKSGDRVLVQVTKDPVGHKGARLTSQISLPGRYLVYVPGGAINGISRKLPDTERARLKKILKEVLPESSGVIVRTAAEGATEDQLTRDVQRLTAQWEHVSRQIESIQAPALLHSEPDLLVKIVRDVFNEDFTRVLIQGEDAHQTITKYVESVAPDLLERVVAYEEPPASLPASLRRGPAPARRAHWRWQVYACLPADRPASARVRCLLQPRRKSTSSHLCLPAHYPYIQLCRLLRIHIERRKRPCEVQWNGMRAEPRGCPPGCGVPSERRTSCR